MQLPESYYKTYGLGYTDLASKKVGDIILINFSAIVYMSEPQS